MPARRNPGIILLAAAAAVLAVWLSSIWVASRVTSPSSAPTRPTTADDQCKRMAGSISLAMSMYMADYATIDDQGNYHHVYPPNLRVLLDGGYLKDPAVFRCPLSPRSAEPVDPLDPDNSGDWFYSPLKPDDRSPADFWNTKPVLLDMSTVPVLWEKDAFHERTPWEKDALRRHTRIMVIFLDASERLVHYEALGKLIDAQKNHYLSPPKLPAILQQTDNTAPAHGEHP